MSCQGRYYKRITNSNHQLRAGEVSDMYMQSMQYSWDAYPHPRATYNDLDTNKISDFITKVNTIGRFKLSTNPFEALLKLQMITHTSITNAAYLLFSKDSINYNIHVGRFKTPSFIIDDKLINSSLFDMTEEAMRFIISHMKVAFEITGKTTSRNEILEYPIPAIRELLLNTIIHRDYVNTSDIQIKIFDTAIQFYNPGGLYGNIRIEDLLSNNYHASTRNKLLAEAFYLTGDIEKYGSGFIRVRNEIADYYTMKFDFENQSSGFVSKLSYDIQKITTENVPENVPKNRHAYILQEITNNAHCTIPELAAKLKVNEKTIKRDIDKLKQQNRIQRIGGAKGGVWEVLPK